VDTFNNKQLDEAESSEEKGSGLTNPKASGEDDNNPLFGKAFIGRPIYK
jgi:hypothetical protein